MDISLTPQLEALIRQKLESGRYHSANEVVREALRLLDERDRLDEAKRQALIRDLQAGIDELDRGEGSELDIEDIKRKAWREFERSR